jgi:23S rRNA pseudouridine2604 synthase
MSTLDKLLMRELKLSRYEVSSLLNQRKVFVNDCLATQPKLALLKGDRISICGEQPFVVKQGNVLRYMLYHKPVGVECSLHPALTNSLYHVTSWDDLYPVGRLDKESEGLVVMTNDGRLYKAITNHDAIEKEYVVSVNRDVTNDELLRLASGIEIMGNDTLPAIVERLDSDEFRIILKEGRNRQIRRMCYKLNLNVTRLIRVRIHDLWLADLKSGEFRNATEVEVAQLKRLYSDRFIAS